MVGGSQKIESHFEVPFKYPRKNVFLILTLLGA